MAGTEKQDNGRPISVYLKDKHKRMANTLIKAGYYDSLSELVRVNIERDFGERITDPREELKMQRQKLENIIKELEEMVENTDSALDALILKYRERKNNMPAKALGNYEKFSKNWISRNIGEAEIAFPGKTVDEIYDELERRINEGK